MSILIVTSACQSNYQQPVSHSHKASAHKVVGKYNRNPQAAAYNVQLGIAYLGQAEHERAKQKLMIAEKQDPHSAMVLDAKAYFLEMTGEIEKAHEYYRKAIKFNPGKGMALNNYGAFLCRQGKYQAAEKQFLLAVQDNQYLSTGEAYENAGLCAIKSQQYVKAEEYLHKAIQKQPKLANSLLSLARLNYDKQNFSAAKQYLNAFNRFAKPEPESIQLAFLLADINNDAEAANANLAQMEKLFPNSNEYQTMREYYG